MIKICFICLGNICRSPMAEFIMKDLAHKKALKLEITSAGTSGYHNGEDMHFKSKAKLREKGIRADGFVSKKLTQKLCDENDLLIVMDRTNFKATEAFNNVKHKLHLLLDFACEIKLKEVPDPWYSGDFNQSYELIFQACLNLCQNIAQNKLKLS